MTTDGHEIEHTKIGVANYIAYVIINQNTKRLCNKRNKLSTNFFKRLISNVEKEINEQSKERTETGSELTRDELLKIIIPYVNKLFHYQNKEVVSKTRKRMYLNSKGESDKDNVNNNGNMEIRNFYGSTNFTKEELMIWREEASDKGIPEISYMKKKMTEVTCQFLANQENIARFGEDFTEAKARKAKKRLTTPKDIESSIILNPHFENEKDGFDKSHMHYFVFGFSSVEENVREYLSFRNGYSSAKQQAHFLTEKAFPELLQGIAMGKDKDTVALEEKLEDEVIAILKEKRKSNPNLKYNFEEEVVKHTKKVVDDISSKIENVLNKPGVSFEDIQKELMENHKILIEKTKIKESAYSKKDNRDKSKYLNPEEDYSFKKKQIFKITNMETNQVINSEFFNKRQKHRLMMDRLSKKVLNNEFAKKTNKGKDFFVESVEKVFTDKVETYKNQVAKLTGTKEEKAKQANQMFYSFVDNCRQDGLIVNLNKNNVLTLHRLQYTKNKSKNRKYNTNSIGQDNEVLSAVKYKSSDLNIDISGMTLSELFMLDDSMIEFYQLNFIKKLFPARFMSYDNAWLEEDVDFYNVTKNKERLLGYYERYGIKEEEIEYNSNTIKLLDSWTGRVLVDIEVVNDDRCLFTLDELNPKKAAVKMMQMEVKNLLINPDVRRVFQSVDGSMSHSTGMVHFYTQVLLSKDRGTADRMRVVAWNEDAANIIKTEARLEIEKTNNYFEKRLKGAQANRKFKIGESPFHLMNIRKLELMKEDPDGDFVMKEYRKSYLEEFNTLLEVEKMAKEEVHRQIRELTAKNVKDIATPNGKSLKSYIEENYNEIFKVKKEEGKEFKNDKIKR